MSDRAARARQLRNRRKQRSLPAIQTEDGEAIEMSATSTIACILLLLCVGASMATSYIMIHNPKCMSSESHVRKAPASAPVVSSTNAAATTAAAPKPATVPVASSTNAVATTAAAPKPAPVPVTTTTTTVSNPVPAPASTVAACSADQMAILRRQMPAQGCLEAPFGQACSFTKATVHASCAGDATGYFRSVVAELTFADTFTAVLAGLKDQDEDPMDLLMVASHDAEKYDTAKWRQIVGQSSCPRPAVALSATKNKARILVLEPDLTKALAAKRWKTTAGLTDDDMQGETTRLSTQPGVGAVMTLNDWAAKKALGPIHYLRTHQAADSFDVLISGAGTGGVLERVWYLDFTYDWKGSWGSQSLQPLITSTLSGFACYWQGADNNLWRISGCWQTHYAQKHWSRVACVNTKIAEAKPIYDKMEYYFQETLKKDLAFN